MSEHALRRAFATACTEAALAVDSLPHESQGDPVGALRRLAADVVAEPWLPAVRRLLDDAWELLDWLTTSTAGHAAADSVVAVHAAAEALREHRPLLRVRLQPERDLHRGWHGDEIRMPAALRPVVHRVADAVLERRLVDLAIHQLVAPPGAVPEPLASRFTTTWTASTVREVGSHQDGEHQVTEVEADAAALSAGAAAVAAIATGDAPVVVAWTYAGVAAVTTEAVLREAPWRLLQSGVFEDCVVFPLDGNWLVTWFHHDHAWVARRHGAALIAVDLPPRVAPAN